GADEGDVHDGDVTLLRQGREVTRVRALHHHDAFVRPERIGELAVAYVDGVDPARARLEETVRETARRGADVGANHTRHVNTEDIERMAELVAAAAHEARPFFDSNGGVRRDEGRRPEHDLAVDGNLAGEEQCLGLVAAGGKAAADQKRIYSLASL